MNIHIVRMSFARRETNYYYSLDRCDSYLHSCNRNLIETIIIASTAVIATYTAVTETS